MRIAAILLGLCGLSLQEGQAPDPEQIQRLIRQLGDDDIVVRQEAALRLERMGEPALPLLRKASEGDAEVRARAGEIARKISTELYLQRPDNQELRKRWKEILSGSFEQRRVAIQAWVRDGGSSPARIDALIGLFEIDPAGPAGSAVGEALSWFCAPRLMAQVERSSTGGVWADPQPVLEFIADWGEYVTPWDASDGARAKLKAGMIPPRQADTSHSYLDEIRLICTLCRITFRVDDDDRRLHWEEPAESLTYWKRWWQGTRNDRIALVDLGLLKRPEAPALSAAELDEWIACLGSENIRHSRSARVLLRELPDAKIPEIRRRADLPGASAGLRTLAERLQLRSRGRILYGSDRGGGRGLYLMNLDGSGARKISGDLRETWQAAPCGEGRWAYGEAEAPDGKKAIYRYDLQGTRPPEKVSDVAGYLWPSPDGGKLAIRTDNSVLHLVDSKTGKDTMFGEAGNAISQIRWASDGSAFAWSSDKSIYILSEGDAKPLLVEDCHPQYGVFSWSPDSKSLAFCRADREGDADAWTCRIEAVDRKSGKRRVLAGPFWTMTDPEWSPDGTRLVYAGNLRQEPAAVEVYDFSHEKVVARLVPLRTKGPMQSRVRWMPDGKTVAYHQSVEGKTNGVVIGEDATVFFDAATGAVQSVNRQIPFFFTPLPGLDWLLARNHQEDTVLWSRDGSRTINLTESPEGEYNEVFLPSPGK